MMDIRLLGLVAYFRARWQVEGMSMFGIGDSYYPKVFALGVYYPRHGEILVAKVLRWELRTWHEIGHHCGYKHTWTLGHVMHPWGFLRGNMGRLAVRDKYGQALYFQST